MYAASCSTTIRTFLSMSIISCSIRIFSLRNLIRSFRSNSSDSTYKAYISTADFFIALGTPYPSSDSPPSSRSRSGVLVNISAWYASTTFFLIVASSSASSFADRTSSSRASTVSSCFACICSISNLTSFTMPCSSADRLACSSELSRYSCAIRCVCCSSISKLSTFSAISSFKDRSSSLLFFSARSSSDKRAAKRALPPSTCLSNCNFSFITSFSAMYSCVAFFRSSFDATIFRSSSSCSHAFDFSKMAFSCSTLL